MYDYELLEMYEFGINNKTYQSIESFQSIIDYKSNEKNNKSFNFGSKPGILFQGESFQNDPLLKDIKLFFLDYFNGELMKKFNLITFDHIIVFTVINCDEINISKQNQYGINGIILLLRHYKIEYQSSSSSKLPFIHLKEIGPSIDLNLRRFEKGNDEIIKQSMNNINKIKSILNKKPRQKNIYLDKMLKGKYGKIYIEQNQQNINKFKRKKIKALRNRNNNNNKNNNIKTTKRKKNSNNKKNRIRMNQNV